ncbi:MAG: hypothetical protein DYG89_53330 [Caldilinea sp. CFX5]|nr:hypothetical protein [Caldilinea sp. CFX5]
MPNLPSLVKTGTGEKKESTLTDAENLTPNLDKCTDYPTQEIRKTAQNFNKSAIEQQISTRQLL